MEGGDIAFSVSSLLQGRAGELGEAGPSGEPGIPVSIRNPALCVHRRTGPLPLPLPPTRTQGLYPSSVYTWKPALSTCAQGYLASFPVCTQGTLPFPYMYMEILPGICPSHRAHRNSSLPSTCTHVLWPSPKGTWALSSRKSHVTCCPLPLLSLQGDVGVPGERGEAGHRGSAVSGRT